MQVSIHFCSSFTIIGAVFSSFLTPGTSTVQAVDRALLVDTLPASRQASGNAWAARMGGIGSVTGFFMYALQLRQFLTFWLQLFMCQRQRRPSPVFPFFGIGAD